MSNGPVLTENEMLNELGDLSSQHIENSIRELSIEEGETFVDEIKPVELEDAVPGPSQVSHLQYLPTEVLENIFQHFSCKDRSRATQVCHRWRNIILTGKCPLPEVNVFNIFDYSIWHNMSHKTLRLKVYELEKNHDLLNVLRLINESASIKIWYKRYSFAAMCIDFIAKAKIKVKSVDLYPYEHYLPLNHLHNQFPDLSALSMRPHGQQFFFEGMDLATFPEFEKMNTLSLDAFTIGPLLQFPEALTTLEISHRKKEYLIDLIPKLRKLKKLEYLALSHGSLEDMDDFAEFLTMVSELKCLYYLILKFTKIPNIRSVDMEGYVPVPPHIYELSTALRMLRLELCYGSISDMTEIICRISKNLQMLKLNILLENDTMQEVISVTPTLQARNILLHCMVLARDGTKEKFTELTFPSSFYSTCTHFEASFVNDEDFFTALLSGPLISFFEFKFIQCDGLTEGHLKSIAEKANRLRRVTVITCKKIREDGFVPFAVNIRQRKSKEVAIMWKSYLENSTTLSMLRYLCKKEVLTIPDLVFVQQKKVLPELDSGEKFYIHDTQTKNTVSIKNYSPNDAMRVMGVVMPEDDDTPYWKELTDLEEASASQDHTDSSTSD